MIALADFTYRAGGKTLLDRVSLQVAPGRLCVIAGPNGAGKSTLLRALAGLLPGTRPDPRRIAYLAQDSLPAWNLTVAELVQLGRLPHGGGESHACGTAMQDCGIAALADRRIATLSGGELRRAALARVLAGLPALLLLDEPLAGLDPAASHDIMRLLRRLAQHGRGVVVVLHALDFAQAYADRLVVLQQGRIIADGVPSAVMPDAARVFGMRLGQDTTPRLLPQQES